MNPFKETSAAREIYNRAARNEQGPTESLDDRSYNYYTYYAGNYWGGLPFWNFATGSPFKRNRQPPKEAK